MWSGEAVTFQLFSYNDSYQEFFAEVFKYINTFEPTQAFFESKKKQLLATMKNLALGEPHTRQSRFRDDILT